MLKSKKKKGFFYIFIAFNVSIFNQSCIRPDCHHHFNANGTSNAMFDELAERPPMSPLAGTKHTYVSLAIVQSLNSPFFPPPIGAEPGRAKRESRRKSRRQSRITCMRMLRTNQSKITRVHTTLLESMCRAMPFSARALKKKTHFL